MNFTSTYVHENRTAITEKCAPCNRHNGEYCGTYIWPDKAWIRVCPMASHMVVRVEGEEKVRVGQQKQKKGE